MCGVLSQAGCAGSAAPVPEMAPVQSEPSPTVFVATFRMQDAGESDSGVPQTRLDFVMHSATEATLLQALGTEEGGCVESTAEAGELLRVSCWWGPAESHWVARVDGGAVELRRIEAPREGLPSSAAAPWTLEHRLPLPEGAQVTRLAH